MNKVQDDISKTLNNQYERLVKLKSDFLAVQEEILNTPEVDRTQEKIKNEKALKKIETELSAVVRKCKRNLLRTIKLGANIVGALEKDLSLKDPQIKNSLSSWARKRGHGFEKWFADSLNVYATESELNAYCYRNFSAAFGFQPYDLVCYLKSEEPIFLECKASGIITNTAGVKIQACSRRYINYTNEVQQRKLKHFLTVVKPTMFFVYREETEKQLYFINYEFVFKNADWLCKKQIDLTPDMYYKLPYDHTQWPENIFKELKQYNTLALNSLVTQEEKTIA